MNSEEERRAQSDYIHPRPTPEREGLSSDFWLPDEDPQEIIAGDEATMADLGIDPLQLARKMAWVVELSRRDEYYCKTFTHDRFTISSAYYRMMVPCPLCDGGGGNGELLVVDNVTLENYWERDQPIYPTGQIELQNHGNTLYFKNVFIRELGEGE